ncbi:MAG: hypothetical protein O7E49_12030 [Gemmatimonadetes bacterium]|nr:hypothetical protein [Gemmatimonadota bacterium]
MARSDAAPKRKRIRGRLKNLGLLCASLIVALLLGELLVRIVEPQQLIERHSGIWQPADSLGYTHRSNLSTTVNTGERTVDLFTDRDGYRVGRNGRQEAETRVLLVGDSFVAAFAVPFEQSLGGRLGTELSAQLGRPVAVRNAGVEGWQPSQYLLQVKRSLALEAVDIVVVALFVGNDVPTRRVDYLPPRTVGENAGLRLPRRPSADELKSAVLYPLLDYFSPRSHLVRLAWTRTELLRMRIGLWRGRMPGHFRKSEAASERWGVTAEICSSIATLVGQHGAPTIFVLLPVFFQADPRIFGADLRALGLDSALMDVDQPNRLLGRALGELRLEVLDLLPVFRIATAEGRELYGRVDKHLSPEGHALAVARLTPMILTHLKTRDSGGTEN